MTDFRSKLVAIETNIDAGRYRPGPWDAFLRSACRQPRSERLALAADVSRISQKLHARHHLRTLSVTAGVGIELLATLAGCGALAIARASGSNLVALLAAGIWITTFQPLIKLCVGLLLGVRYDYAYLRGVEPRFKMRYGTYLAAPRWARIVVHLSGTVGSPLAAWLVGTLTRPGLALSGRICGLVFWTTSALNALLFLAALIGWRRIGPARLTTTSGGAAALELREALAGET